MDLIRLEVFMNSSLREMMIEELKLINIRHFTLIPDVFGEGRQEPKYGDAIWPEMNFILLMYVTQKEYEAVFNSLKLFKKEFPLEGIKIFKSGASFESLSVEK